MPLALGRAMIKSNNHAPSVGGTLGHVENHQKAHQTDETELDLDLRARVMYVL